ncbi:MAG: PrsW family intramembrane metalloprotease [Caldilineaceae bacterium]|nr:PrsW family intramembrane metalloprotease [Caldilineaceae bacterium]
MNTLQPERHSWWRILLSAFLFYLLSLGALVLTGNPNLFPTVVLLGVFMVPAAYAAFFYDQRHLSKLGAGAVVRSFLYGGLLGVTAASILEPLLVHSLTPATVFTVAMIEEFVKILGVVIIAWRLRHDAEIDGIILGAAAGMGFAALESMGYAFTGFLRSGGSLSFTVYLTMIRGIMSPLGHGTWTAILAAVLFREAQGRRLHLNWKVWLAYGTAVLLHALWDLLPFIMAAFLLPGLDLFLGQAIVGLVGVLILWGRWREGRQRQETEAASAAIVVPAGEVSTASENPLLYPHGSHSTHVADTLGD